MNYDQGYLRNIGVFSSEQQDKLRHAKVTVAGGGGVGGIQAVTLARMGIGEMTIMDPGVFEQLGFFFSGILPRGLRGHDSLMLQYLNNTRVDSSLLAPFSGEARKILEYIKRHDPGLRQ